MAKPAPPTDLVERDRFTSGALHAVAFARADDPAADLARLQIGIGIPELDYRFVELNAETARGLAMTLLAFANGNWVEISEQGLTATGKARLRQTDFGIKPVSAGGGTVKVKNELGLDFRIVARAGR